MRCYAVLVALGAVPIVSTEHIGRANGDNSPATTAQLGLNSFGLPYIPQLSKRSIRSPPYALPIQTFPRSDTATHTTMGHRDGSPTQTTVVPSTKHSASSSDSTLAQDYCQQLTAPHENPSGSPGGFAELDDLGRKKHPDSYASYYAAVESCRLSSAESVVSSVQSVLSTLTATVTTTHEHALATSMPTTTTSTTTKTVSSDGIAPATAVPFALGGLGVAVLVLM